MKHTFKKLLAGLVLTAVAAPALAVKYTDSNMTISSVTTFTSGVLVTLTTPGANTNGCSLSGANQLAFLGTGTVAARTQLATLLAAHVSNKPITIGLNNCTDWGSGGTIPTMYRVAF